MIIESTSPTRPAAMRIQPTVWMSIPDALPVTANARIAPRAIRRMLTGIPMPPSCPNGVKKERPRHAALARVLLERLEAEAGAHDDVRDPTQTPEPVGEVVGVPALQPVDAERDRVRLVDEQLAAGPQRRREARRPRLEVVELPHGALGRVHEVEAAAPELGG